MSDDLKLMRKLAQGSTLLSDPQRLEAYLDVRQRYDRIWHEAVQQRDNLSYDIDEISRRRRCNEARLVRSHDGRASLLKRTRDAPTLLRLNADRSLGSANLAKLQWPGAEDWRR